MQRLFKIACFAVFLNAMMWEDPSFCGMFCVIPNNPMFCNVFNTSPLQNPMQQFSKTTCFASVSVQKGLQSRRSAVFSSQNSEVCSVQPFFGQVPFKNPDGKFHAVRSAPDAVPRSYMRGHGVCTLHWDSCIQRRMPTPTAAWVGADFCRKTHGKLGSAAPLYSGRLHSFLWFAPPKARVNSATNGLGIACERRSPNAQQCSSWTLHGPVFGVQHRVLCWPYGGVGWIGDTAQQVGGNFQSALLGPWFQRQGSKTTGFWQNAWGQFWVRNKASRPQFFNSHHSTPYDVNITRKPQKGDNDNVCLHLWELWMPHLKYLSIVADRSATLPWGWCWVTACQLIRRDWKTVTVIITWPGN